MTEQQVPMLLRLIMLLQALQQKELKQSKEPPTEMIPSHLSEIEASEGAESWAGWAWSFVPSILPVHWDEEWNREQQMATKGHTLQIGFYIDNASLTFKVMDK